MRKLSVTVIGLALMALAACDRASNTGSLATDSALARDLNLASQAQPFRLDSVSPLETAQMAPAEDSEPIAAAPAPVPRRTPQARTARARRTPGTAPKGRRWRRRAPRPAPPATAARRTDSALGLLARSRALVSTGQTADDLYREAVERIGRSPAPRERIRRGPAAAV